MATMYLLVGISGAGKTTWAKTRLAGAEYIGSDGIRMELFGKELTLRGYHRVHRIMNQRMRAALEQGRDVVVDSVHLSRRARRRVLRAVPEGVRCVAVWIDTGVGYPTSCRRSPAPVYPLRWTGGLQSARLFLLRRPVPCFQSFQNPTQRGSWFR